MTREEFYQKCLEERGYVCPANEFDDPDFHNKRFADTCNAAACPYYKSICRIFGGKKKTPSQRRKLVEKLKEDTK